MGGLYDLGAEEALFETSFYWDFAGISGTQRTPDRVSILRFRPLLEVHKLNSKILNDDCSVCVRQFRQNLGYKALEFPAGGKKALSRH